MFSVEDFLSHLDGIQPTSYTEKTRKACNRKPVTPQIPAISAHDIADAAKKVKNQTRQVWEIKPTAPVNIMSFLDEVKTAPEPIAAPTQSRIYTAVIMPGTIPKPRLIAPVQPTQEETKPTPAALEIVMYSPKSFAVFGTATKERREELADLGGTFNAWLKKDGKPTPGYIFSLRRLYTVRTALNL